MLSLTLAAGESCTVSVRFRPTATGVRSGLLSFWDNTLAGRVNAALSGNAVPRPESSAAPTSVDFGPVQLGMSSDPVTVTLSNSGGGPLAFWRFGIASSSANAADFAVVDGGTCALSVALATGESCTVLVRFKPTSTGARSGLLSFWDNTLAGRTNVALGGAGTAGSSSLLSPASVDFGSVQVGLSSDPVTVTLSNTGGGNLTFWRFGIASSSVNPTDFAVVAGGTCALSLTLATGESCTVLVRFRPAAPGARSGLLSFWDNSPAGRVNVALGGTAQAPSEPSLSPSTVDFGTLQVGLTSAPVTVTLSNAGAGGLTFWRFGIATSSASPTDFTVVAGGTCALSLTLATGESCTVLVRFRPTTSGVRSGLLSFWDNTLAGRIDLALTGYGLDECGPGGCF